MQPIEIIVIIVAVLIVVAVFGTAIYKKVKGIPSDSCGECSKSCNGKCSSHMQDALNKAIENEFSCCKKK